MISLGRFFTRNDDSQVARVTLWFFLGPMDVPIQVWHLTENMRKDFSEHDQMQDPMTENQFARLGMMSQIAKQVGMDCPKIPDSIYVTHL